MKHITQEQAKRRAIKTTAYCYTLAVAWLGEEFNSMALERIYVRALGTEEIRLSWWQDNRLMLRPGDIQTHEWLLLFARAVKKGVFTIGEIHTMHLFLQGHVVKESESKA